jgi:hypothetical protein
MKKDKEILNLWLAVGILLLITFGGGYLKYKIWRWEHPNVSSWVFFITKK